MDQHELGYFNRGIHLPSNLLHSMQQQIKENIYKHIGLNVTVPTKTIANVYRSMQQKDPIYNTVDEVVNYISAYVMDEIGMVNYYNSLEPWSAFIMDQNNKRGLKSHAPIYLHGGPNKAVQRELDTLSGVRLDNTDACGVNFHMNY